MSAADDAELPRPGAYWVEVDTRTAGWLDEQGLLRASVQAGVPVPNSFYRPGRTITHALLEGSPDPGVPPSRDFRGRNVDEEPRAVRGGTGAQLRVQVVVEAAGGLGDLDLGGVADNEVAAPRAVVRDRDADLTVLDKTLGDDPLNHLKITLPGREGSVVVVDVQVRHVHDSSTDDTPGAASPGVTDATVEGARTRAAGPDSAWPCGCPGGKR